MSNITIECSLQYPPLGCVSKCHPVPDPDRYLQVLASSSSTHIYLPRHSVNTFVSLFFRGRGLAELTLKYITLDKRAERLRSSRGWFSRELGAQCLPEPTL